NRHDDHGRDSAADEPSAPTAPRLNGPARSARDDRPHRPHRSGRRGWTVSAGLLDAVSARLAEALTITAAALPAAAWLAISARLAVTPPAVSEPAGGRPGRGRAGRNPAGRPPVVRSRHLARPRPATALAQWPGRPPPAGPDPVSLRSPAWAAALACSRELVRPG